MKGDLSEQSARLRYVHHVSVPEWLSCRWYQMPVSSEQGDLFVAVLNVGSFRHTLNVHKPAVTYITSYQRTGGVSGMCARSPTLKALLAAHTGQVAR